MRGSIRRLALLASKSAEAGAGELWFCGHELASVALRGACSGCGASTSSSVWTCLPAWFIISPQPFRGMAMASRHRQENPHTREARGVEARNIPSDPYRTPPQNYVQLLVHIKKARSITYLEKLLSSFQQQFDAVHCAAAITRLPRLIRRSPDPDVLIPISLLERGRATLSKLQEMVRGHIPSLYPRQISNIIWAVGQMKHLRSKQSFQLVQELLRALRSHQYTRLFMHANQLDIANLCSGLAQLGYTDQQLMDKLVDVTKKRISQFQARQVSQVAWGYAKLGVHNQELMNALAEHAVENANYFNPQGMTNTLWAYATLHHEHPKLLAALAKAAELQMHRFRTQDLAVTAWGFSKFAHQSPELMSKLEKRSLECLERFTPRGLAMLLQGFAKLGHACPQLMDAVSEGIAKEAHVRGKPEDVAGVAWAYATLKHKNELSQRLFQKLSTVGQQLMPLVGPSHLRTLLTSSHELGYLDRELMQAAAQHLLSNCTDGWKLQDTAFLVNDFHNMGFNDSDFLSQLASLLIETPNLTRSDPVAAINLLLIYVRTSQPCRDLVETTARVLCQPSQSEPSSTGEVVASSRESEMAAAQGGSQQEAGETLMAAGKTVADMKLRKLAGLLYCCAKAEAAVPPMVVEVVAAKVATEEVQQTGASGLSRLLQGLVGVDPGQLKDFPWEALWRATESHADDLSSCSESEGVMKAARKLPQAPAALMEMLKQQQ